MKRINLLILLIITWLSTSCLNAPRDNKYDPENPDRSSLCGYLYEPDRLAVEGAVIDLACEGSIVMADTSDSSGFFTLEGIEPGIYTITALARYYQQLAFEAESLWAGTNASDFNMTFTTFNFEDDEEQACEPYGFQVVCGNWEIGHDEQDPEMHSTPHVYRSVCDSQSNIALSLFRSKVKNCDCQVKFKVPSLPDTMWRTGLIFGYQNIYNFDILEVTSNSVILKYVVDSVSTIDKIKSLSLSENTWHSIEMRYIDGRMTFYHNNGFLFSILDYSFPEANIGLWAINLQDEITSTVVFDDVTILQH